MSSTEKLLYRFLKNPGSMKFKKIETLLFRLGFDKAGIKGSHHSYSYPIVHLTFIIPVHNNDCKLAYKKKIAKSISENLNLFKI
jgi:predicted RNA binding protein YcfA (HicA-like mRNA interferase family)